MIHEVLITGCSRGIGRALALHLASRGQRVLAVSRNAASLSELASHHSLIQPVTADITTADGRQRIRDAAEDRPLSIIHNAAVSTPSSFANLSEQLLRSYVETNYIAPLLITQQLLPNLTARQRILHISSGAATMAIPGLMPYCATKAAMHQATSVLDVELNAKGIACANLRPGMVDTELQAKWRETDPRQLPSQPSYINAEKEGQLLSPQKVAVFVGWVLLDTPETLFRQTYWNIYDASWHDQWLPAGEAAPLIKTK